MFGHDEALVSASVMTQHPIECIRHRDAADPIPLVVKAQANYLQRVLPVDKGCYGLIQSFGPMLIVCVPGPVPHDVGFVIRARIPARGPDGPRSGRSQHGLEDRDQRSQRKSGSSS